MSELEGAKRVLAYELERFARGKEDDYFHPMERDHWIPRFCEWLAEEQRKSAEIRASND